MNIVKRGMAVREAMTAAVRKLGYETLRVEQVAVVETFIGGQDVFAALPTGYGKSLCWPCYHTCSTNCGGIRSLGRLFLWKEL